jgi:hypothetical protein
MFNARIGFICNTNNNSGLKKTTNGGQNWLPVANVGFYDTYFVDSLTGWCAGGYIKKTTDGGLSWVQQSLPQGIPGQTLINDFRNISKYNRDTIWGSYGYVIFPNLSGRGILYHTTNGGVNWSYQLPDTSIITIPAQYDFCLFLNKRIGWAYSIHSGIHTTVGGDTTFLSAVHQISNIVPDNFQLYQNYPNPFNPSTTIGYYLKESGKVKLTVFDITGKEIVTLVNEVQSTGGYGMLVGSPLTSGVYFYRLVFQTKYGAWSDTKKMVLVK